MLSHPMLLLVAGALISSLIFPYITRQWQLNEKEFEIKTELVEEINEAVTNMITAQRLNLGQFAANRTSQFVNAFTEWETSKDVIGSKIDLYFPSDQLPERWDNLSSAVSGFHGISAATIADNLKRSLIKDQNWNNTYNTQMCARLGNVLLLHSFYSQNSINIDPDAWISYDCDRIYVYSLKDLPVEKVLAIRDVEVNRNVPVDDGEINWNSIFLRHYESKTAADRLASGYEFLRNHDKLREKITDHKNDILAAVSRTNIAAFR